MLINGRIQIPRYSAYRDSRSEQLLLRVAHEMHEKATLDNNSIESQKNLNTSCTLYVRTSVLSGDTAVLKYNTVLIIELVTRVALEIKVHCRPFGRNTTKKRPFVAVDRRVKNVWN